MNQPIKKIKIFIVNLTLPLFKVLRPLLGVRGVCIYPIDCSTYARFTFENKPLLIAIPLICLRILSCNPITALILKFNAKRLKSLRLKNNKNA